jgi:uncharacterized protein with PIN domain
LLQRHHALKLARVSARFVTDSSLTFLARRLRFLGYDVQVLSGARLDEVFEAGRSERRTVLTLSARHPRRFADVPACRIARGHASSAVREIASLHAPPGPPFTRCPQCNASLRRRPSLEASGEVPERVLSGARWLSFCPLCDKWYWEGSHVARLRRWLEEALGRPLQPDRATEETQ